MLIFPFPYPVEIKSAGDAMRDMSQPITTPLHVPQSQFARLCQAAILASHCIRTRQDPPPSSPEPIFALADELRRFDAILESEAWHGGPIAAVTDITDRLPAPRYVVVSAMFVLIDPYCYPVPATPEHHQPPQAKTPEQVELQRRAKDTATHVVERAYGSLKEVLEVVGDRAVPSPSEAEQLGACSPFGLDAIYRIMVVYGWLCHETGDGQNKDRMHDMENILGILGVRWGLARVYCRLNKYHDLLQDLD
jgi:hypothetical protein